MNADCHYYHPYLNFKVCTFCFQTLPTKTREYIEYGKLSKNSAMALSRELFANGLHQYKYRNSHEKMMAIIEKRLVGKASPSVRRNDSPKSSRTGVSKRSQSLDGARMSSLRQSPLSGKRIAASPLPGSGRQDEPANSLKDLTLSFIERHRSPTSTLRYCILFVCQFSTSLI